MFTREEILHAELKESLHRCLLVGCVGSNDAMGKVNIMYENKTAVSSARLSLRITLFQLQLNSCLNLLWYLQSHFEEIIVEDRGIPLCNN